MTCNSYYHLEFSWEKLFPAHRLYKIWTSAVFFALLSDSKLTNALVPYIVPPPPEVNLLRCYCAYNIWVYCYFYLLLKIWNFMPSVLSICPCGIDHGVCVLSNGQQGGHSTLQQRSQILNVYEKIAILLTWFITSVNSFLIEFMVPVVHFKTSSI